MDLRYLIGAVVVSTLVPVGNSAAQTDSDEAHPITLVGCIMRESDFRDMYGPGRSGPRGPGIGLRNEYMIVDAHEVSAGGSGVTETTGTCPPAPGGFPTAYELTGPRETEVAPFPGHRVELTGMQKHAKTRAVGTSGVRQPTGGFDPLGHELHLFEVEVSSVREASAPSTTVAAAAPATEAPAPVPAAEVPAPAPAAEAAATPEASTPPPSQPETTPAVPPAAPAETAAAAPAAAPAPEASAAQQTPQPQPEQQRPRQVAAAQLPKTASPLPLVGLMGLLSLIAAAGLRLFER